MSSSEDRQLHIFFFPFMAHGHMIPTLDMAKLFASRGVKSTIVTTPLNVPIFQKPIDRSKRNNPGLDIGVMALDFPCKDLGLPEGCENLDFITSNPSAAEGSSSLLQKFFSATKYLKQPLEKLIEKIRPDSLVAGMFFPWATEAAEKFGVPRLVFHGTSVFALSAGECVTVYEPHKKLSSDDKAFVIPNLPGDIVMTADQIVDHGNTGMKEFMNEVKESDKKCYGVLVNSFYELESDYADFYRNVFKRKSWHVGPVLSCNRGIEEKAERGKKANIDEHECLKWLDSKKPNSVIYTSFGSLSNLPDAQLMEIAVGLERSEQNFIWVVRRYDKKGEKEEWLPEGFEERTKGKGLIIRGWAPQLLILDHQAIGGFVTHCGWNSILEGISAGLPMVTWPVGAEQFYNEKLVTQVLKTGFSVGVQKWVWAVGDFISRDKVEKAVRELMVGEKAEERRIRAEELAKKAKAAMEKGGSSYNDLNRFMEEMKLIRDKRLKEQGAESV